MITGRPLIVAVAGNPNAGKSTLINAIAGSRLHVGNWPGVTVEKKEAVFDAGGRSIRLDPLPFPLEEGGMLPRSYAVTTKTALRFPGGLFHVPLRVPARYGATTYQTLFTPWPYTSSPSLSL